MTFWQLVLHLFNFALPALAMALFMPWAGRWVIGPGRASLRRRMGVQALCGLAVLVGGLAVPPTQPRSLRPGEGAVAETVRNGRAQRIAPVHNSHLVLSTSLGTTAFSAGQSLPAEATWNAALSASAPLSSQASLRGNYNTERSNSGQTRHSLNLGASWRIDARWSLEGNYNRSTGRSRFSPSLDPLAPLALVVPESDRSF